VTRAMDGLLDKTKREEETNRKQEINALYHNPTLHGPAMTNGGNLPGSRIRDEQCLARATPRSD